MLIDDMHESVIDCLADAQNYLKHLLNNRVLKIEHTFDIGYKHISIHGIMFVQNHLVAYSDRWRGEYFELDYESFDEFSYLFKKIYKLINDNKFESHLRDKTEDEELLSWEDVN